jgi:hypothetical protein
MGLGVKADPHDPPPLISRPGFASVAGHSRSLSHAAEAEGGDLKAVCSKDTLFHHRLFSRLGPVDGNEIEATDFSN